MNKKYNEVFKRNPLDGYLVFIKESKETRAKECFAAYDLRKNTLKNITNTQMMQDYKKKLQSIDSDQYELFSLFINDKQKLLDQGIDTSTVVF